MTEIMEIMQTKILNNSCRNLSLDEKHRLLQKMTEFFQAYKIQCYRQNQEFIALLSNQFFCRPETKELELFGILKIQVCDYMVSFILSLFDHNGCAIRAKSQHQKTGLSKFCNILNSSSQTMTFMCHPLNGEIKFIINYLNFHPELMGKALENILNIIGENKNQIQKILQFLELIPSITNKFLQGISNKMEKCRTLILGPHKGYIPSLEQESHQQYFMESLPPYHIVYSWLQPTLNRIHFEQLVKNLLNKLVFQSYQVKKFNFLTVEVAPDFITFIDNQRKMGRDLQQVHQVAFVGTQKKLSQKIHINLIRKSNQRLQEETKALERIAKKGNKYYKFIKQYYYIKNCQELRSKFIAHRHQKMTSLRSLLMKNKQVMSYYTKLHLCFQLVSVAYIGLLKIKRFLPSYQSYDLNVMDDHHIKLETVVSYYKNTIASVQIAQTCYQVLYNVRCSSHCLKQIDQKIKIKKWYHQIKTVDDGQSKYQGISIINYWLKKVLLDLINNQQYPQNFINTYKKSHTQNSSTPYMDSYSNLSLETVYKELQKDSQEILSQQAIHELQHLKKLLFVVGLAYKSAAEVYGYRVDQLSCFDLDDQAV